MVVAGYLNAKLPITASHEGSGTVVALGPSVQGFQEGDRVICGLYRDQCGVCQDCKGPENYKQYCINSGGIIGITVDGAFAEYVVIDARNAAKLPDKVSHETSAPLACAGSTIFRGVLQSGLKSGEWLAIVGSGGGLGHLGIQFAKATGLKVIGIDARDEGLALTRDTGADIIIDARKGTESVVQEVNKATNNEGADATICVSDDDSAAGLACAVTKMHGTMVQIAQPMEIKIPFKELIFRDIRIKGSLICSPEESKRMLQVVAEHSISVKTNPFYGLNEIPKLVDLAHGGRMKGKGIIIVDKEQIENERKPNIELV